MTQITKTFSKRVKITKVDEDLGLVFGYAIVCKVGDEIYIDTQDDHIPESTMLKATFKFAKGARIAKEMHDGDAIGEVVFLFPMTTDIAKSLGITLEKSGLIIGMKPDEPEVLAKFASGEYSGFSIGGSRVSDTVIEND